MRSGKSKRSGTSSRNPNERVQVISDFESSDESMADISQNDLEQINKNIDDLESEALKEKRETNIYDLLCIQQQSNPLYEAINGYVQAYEASLNKKCLSPPSFQQA